MDIIRTADRDLLRAVFREDPVASMYMAGDLEESLFRHCEWFAAIENGAPVAAVLVFHGLATPAVAATGVIAGVREILAAFQADLPDRFYVKLDSRQYPLFRAYFDLEGEEMLGVMSLDVFRSEPPAPGVAIRLLQPTDPPDEILAVYRDYPGNFFEPSQIACNLYCGAWKDGELAAVAGTHSFAPRERLAIVGNVVTSARVRGCGLCRQTCSFLVEELRSRGCEFIGLHVAESNQAAVRCYRSIGFAMRGSLLHVVASRDRS